MMRRGVNSSGRDKESQVGRQRAASQRERGREASSKDKNSLTGCLFFLLPSFGSRKGFLRHFLLLLICLLVVILQGAEGFSWRAIHRLSPRLRPRVAPHVTLCKVTSLRVFQQRHRGRHVAFALQARTPFSMSTSTSLNNSLSSSVSSERKRMKKKHMPNYEAYQYVKDSENRISNSMSKDFSILMGAIQGLDKKIDDKFSAIQSLSVDIKALDKKFESKFSALDVKITALDRKVEDDIKALDKNFDDKFSALDVKVTALDRKVEVDFNLFKGGVICVLAFLAM